jgi:hypothetical protein
MVSGQNRQDKKVMRVNGNFMHEMHGINQMRSSNYDPLLMGQGANLRYKSVDCLRQNCSDLEISNANTLASK